MLPRGFPIITFSACESSPTFFFRHGNSFVSKRWEVIRDMRQMPGGDVFFGGSGVDGSSSTSCLFFVGYLQ